MDALFESCPRVDFHALEDEILGTALENDNCLFYRSAASFTSWPEADAASEAWELHCTACHQRFFEPKRRKFKPSKLVQCPNCGAMVTAKRWREDRSKLRTRILFYKFRRGEGRQVWLHAYAVTHDFCPAPGDERLEFFEMARYLFEDGRAHKWAQMYDEYGWNVQTGWVKRKRVTDTRWWANRYSWDGRCYERFVGEIDPEMFRGSCLEYSQLPEAMSEGFQPAEYLAFYLKNPMIEYLWKFGFTYQLREGLMQGKKALFRKVFNLRAKKPKDLLRGLTLPEAREIAKNDETLETIYLYQQMKREGVVHGSPQCWEWARAASRGPDTVKRAERLGIGGKQLRAYIERQAKRSGHMLSDTLHDWGDYLDQLRQLGAAGGELLPDDLQASHERLSTRLGELGRAGLNRRFRTRRRLYQWLRWRHGGRFIRPVDSVEEITREGELQRNCVAGYANRHADGNTIICVLRRASEPGKPWHTVELDPETLTVRQCRSYRNASAEPEAQAFIEAWTERLQNIRLTKVRKAV